MLILDMPFMAQQCHTAAELSSHLQWEGIAEIVISDQGICPVVSPVTLCCSLRLAVPFSNLMHLTQVSDTAESADRLYWFELQMKP